MTWVRFLAFVRIQSGYLALFSPAELQLYLFSSSLGILNLLSVICPNSDTFLGDTSDTSGKISCLFQSLMFLNNKYFLIFTVE